MVVGTVCGRVLFEFVVHIGRGLCSLLLLRLVVYEWDDCIEALLRGVFRFEVLLLCAQLQLWFCVVCLMGVYGRQISVCVHSD